MKRWMWGTAGLAALALVAKVMLHFPWRETGEALTSANGVLLGAALLVNLISPVVKGWSWHMLLGRVSPTPPRWWVTQEANFVGTAVNVVGVATTGEAARASFEARHDRVPVRIAILSVVAARVVEALGLAAFVLLAPLAFPLPPSLRAVQVGGGLLLLAFLLVRRFRVLWALRPAGVELGTMMTQGLLGPTLLAVVNWIAQWGAYYLAIRAVHVPATPAAALVVLLASNLGGLVRLTPANIGVLQAAMVAALLPFGVPVQQSVAAGLALQAIQVLPILAIGLALAGRAGLRPLHARRLTVPSGAADPN